MSDLPGKRIAESRVTLSALMGPQQTNGLGNIHGGVIMKMVDEAGGIAAMRHARRPTVTVAVDSMTFMHPIRVGMMVQCNAELTLVGRTSMEVCVEVIAENLMEGISVVSNTAFLVYVALDETGRPTNVAPLIYESEAERVRAEQARIRQAYRKQQQAQNAASTSATGSGV